MNWRSLLVGCASAALANQTAHAQDYTRVNIYQAPPRYSYAWHDPTLVTGIGIGVHIGGGIGGFTGDTVRDAVDSNVAGMWTVRATLGTHVPLAIDLAYVGSAATITPLGDDGSLVGTAFEGAVRWNVLPHFAWNPYVFVGLGWQRYDTSDVELSTADTGLADDDDLAVVPMGIGFAYRSRSGMVFDVRGTYRVAGGSSLVESPDGGDASLDTWEASATLGYEL